MSQHSEDSNHLDVYQYNEDPEHEFLLSQIVRSSSPDGSNIELSLESNPNINEPYIPRRRRVAFHAKKNEVFVDTSLSHSTSRSNPNSPTASIRSDRDAYELQLLNLQTQLEAAAIENSRLTEELNNERVRSSTVFPIPPTKGAAMTAQTVEVKSGETTWENIVCEKAKVEDKKEEKPVGKLNRIISIFYLYKEVASAWIWNFLSEFHLEDREESLEEVKEESFAPSVLSENIKRVSKKVQPYVNSGKKINKVLNWEKRFETLIVFLLFMISAYTGYSLQLLILLMLWRLSVNYIVATGLASRFGIFEDEIEVEEVEKDEKNWMDKVSMARVILLKVQIIAGEIANGLEKINNLMAWRVPVVTMRLYRLLWVALFASWLLPTSFLLKLVGIMMGVKMFIISPVYNKYPRVKAKYDTVSKLWAMLPTDDKLNEIDHIQAIKATLPANYLESEESRNTPQAQAKERHILTKFGLTSKESIVEGWLQGKRANLMNRGNLLGGYKSGKLYLTDSHLCFEKLNASHQSDRIMIHLKEVQSISKAKPFQILPGSGMSIEVFMKEEKSYLFAAIFSRDEVFKDIIETGLLKGYTWAIKHEEV